MSSSTDLIASHRDQYKLLLDTCADPTIKHNLTEFHEPISPPKVEDYRLPLRFKKTMSPALLEQLRSSLSELWKFREQVAGLPVIDAMTLYSGDPVIHLLQDEFIAWGTAYLTARLNRPAPRDKGQPFLTFRRLYNELIPWISALQCLPHSGHGIVLKVVVFELLWRLYQRTYASQVEYVSDGQYYYIDIADNSIRDAASTLVLEIFKYADHVDLTMRDFPLMVEPLPENAREELANMAEDIYEIQGRLAASYNPTEHIIPIADGVYGLWIWSFQYDLGTVLLGDPDALRRYQHTKGLPFIDVGRDGLATSFVCPRHSFDSDAQIGWMLGLLRPIHHALLTYWEQLGPLPASAAENGDLEAVTLGCERILVDDEEDIEHRPKHRNIRLPQVRTSKLLGVLERHFDCTIGSGKGSEITVFREGGKIYTLPGHKRNTRYSSRTIHALLARVGISPREFAEVICRRVEYR